MHTQIHNSHDHQDFRQLRHRWEMPLIWASFFTTVIAVLFALVIFSLDDATLTGTFGESTQSVQDFAQIGLSVLFLPIVIFIIRFYYAARDKSNAIRVGPNQLPKLWALYQDLGKRMDMKTLPKLYVKNGNGVVNAYALSCNRRVKYIILHAEVALALDTMPEIVEFVLAHEMAHHKLHHVSLWRIIIGIVPNASIVLGKSTTRAQEYSADRVALSVCNHHEQAMNVLAIGPWMNSEVDAAAWLEQCEEEHKELYIRFVNLISDHAVMVKRYKALKDIDEHGFSRHGEMF